MAMLGWLSGSSVWMTAQLLFEPEIHKSRTAPWYSGSIFAGSADHYHWGVYLMRVIHVATLLGLMVFYAVSLKGASFASVMAKISKSTPNPTLDAIHQRRTSYDNDEPAATPIFEPNAQVLVFGLMAPEVYSKIFIVPWIIKDIFWSTRSFIPAILCMILATVLMADYLCLFKKWKNLAMVLWTVGSAVWLSNDLVMHDEEIWPLLLSIVVFAVGSCILSGALVMRPNNEDPREIYSNQERDVLL